VSLNRVVVILTPLVFAPLAGFITLLLAKLGIHPSDSSVQGVVIQGGTFALGALIAFAKAHKWLQGWQSWEKRQDWITHSALDQRFTTFLEELAEKTGTKLPSYDGLPLVANNVAEPEPPPPAFEPGAMTDSAPGE
jgi:hypothetical protein